jgi:phage-related protein
MWLVEYYAEPNSGREPVAEWLDSLDKHAGAHILDKIVRLHQNGLVLLNTSMMKPIKGHGGGNFYELRCGKYRILLLHDFTKGKFILLHGFKKERQRESKQIETAYLRLREYQLRR